jgi:hypothetical protein
MLVQESIEVGILQAIRLSRKAMFKGISTPNGNLSTVRSEISSWIRARTLVSKAKSCATKHPISRAGRHIKRAVIEFWCVFISSDDPWNALAYVNFRFVRSGEGGS